jgi:hypothetical protein
MRVEILIFIIAGLIIANIYTEGFNSCHECL